jgi:hypothetical protein
MYAIPRSQPCPTQEVCEFDALVRPSTEPESYPNANDGAVPIGDAGNGTGHEYVNDPD